MSAPVKELGIVVAVDGSPASTVAAGWAAREAAMRHIPLTVVHAVSTPAATFPPVPYPESLVTSLEDEGKKA
ncbi:universal stress protein, partial [Mycobacterium colombiense]